MFKAVLDYENFSMTLQSGRPVTQMQYVRHLLGTNCCQGWWHGKSDLQCLELSRRYIRHMGSHSRVVFLKTILIVMGKNRNPLLPGVTKLVSMLFFEDTNWANC